MKIKARIQKILEVQTGTSKAGREWKKQAFIVTQFNSFKDDLYCEMWNKDIDLLTVRKEGETVEKKNYQFDYTSKQFVDRYGPNATAWADLPEDNKPTVGTKVKRPGKGVWIWDGSNLIPFEKE